MLTRLVTVTAGCINYQRKTTAHKYIHHADEEKWWPNGASGTAPLASLIEEGK